MSTEDGQKDSAKTVAAIDIGSNSLRMAIADVYPDGRIDVLERTRQPVRLGHDTFVVGKLSQQTVGAVIKILRDYRRILDLYGAQIVHAVATSAVREASNRDSFLDRVARTVGLEVDVIEPMEQSRLIVSAVRNAVGDSVDLKRGVALIAEVGGGSTLATILRGGEISDSHSFNLGSIRMQEMLSTAQEPPERAAGLLHDHIENMAQMATQSLELGQVGTFLAIGGDARFAVRQIGEPMPCGDLSVVSQDKLDRLVDECSPHSAEELARIYSLPFADAETLAPALVVYQALLHATQAGEMIVSEVSMRDGLLLDMPRYVTGQQDPALTESIILSVKTMAGRFHYDFAHAEHVAHLAGRLFDMLQGDHQLSQRHRLLLRVAALLHDVGVFVSSRAHHKHSYYLISHAEIFGLRREDIAIVAHVARYHRRSIPKSSHVEYMALPQDRRMLVNKLAAMLRVADALDKSRRQHVRDFDLEQQGQDLVIYAQSEGDLALERRALAVKGDLFEDVFAMRARLEEQAPPLSDSRRAQPTA